MVPAGIAHGAVVQRSALSAPLRAEKANTFYRVREPADGATLDAFAVVLQVIRRSALDTDLVPPAKLAVWCTEVTVITRISRR